VAFLPGVGPVTRFVAVRSFGLGAALVRAALPDEADRERLRARATTVLSRSWDASLDAVLSEQLIERTSDRLLAEGVAERIAERVLAGPELDRIVDRSLEDDRFEVLLTRVVERAVDRLLSQGVAERIA
jgi:hypothetical protein